MHWYSQDPVSHFSGKLQHIHPSFWGLHWFFWVNPSESDSAFETSPNLISFPSLALQTDLSLISIICFLQIKAALQLLVLLIGLPANNIFFSCLSGWNENVWEEWKNLFHRFSKNYQLFLLLRNHCGLPLGYQFRKTPTLAPWIFGYSWCFLVKSYYTIPISVF